MATPKVILEEKLAEIQVKRQLLADKRARLQTEIDAFKVQRDLLRDEAVALTAAIRKLDSE